MDECKPLPEMLSMMVRVSYPLMVVVCQQGPAPIHRLRVLGFGFRVLGLGLWD